ncbi:unnamed protein product [Ectocarpus sp. 6 AP-2014]
MDKHILINLIIILQIIILSALIISRKVGISYSDDSDSVLTTTGNLGVSLKKLQDAAYDAIVKRIQKRSDDENNDPCKWVS